jgi:hypothetical protein
MRRNPVRLGLLVACALLAIGLAAEATVAAGDPVASLARRGKGGKIIAAPRFTVPEQMLVPARPEGSPTVTATVAGRLVMRCFTSAWSDGIKVKCPKPVLRTCVAGRAIEVYAPYDQTEKQFVSAGPNGSFAAPVTFEDDFLTVHLLLAPIRAQSKGFRIVCFPMGSFSVDISEARP